MADEILPDPPAPATPIEDHPPLGGAMMEAVVYSIVATWGVSHILWYALAFATSISAEDKAGLLTSQASIDNLMLICAGYFLGSSQGGRDLSSRIARQALR